MRKNVIAQSYSLNYPTQERELIHHEFGYLNSRRYTYCTHYFYIRIDLYPGLTRYNHGESIYFSDDFCHSYAGGTPWIP